MTAATPFTPTPQQAELLAQLRDIHDPLPPAFDFWPWLFGALGLILLAAVIGYWFWRRQQLSWYQPAQALLKEKIKDFKAKPNTQQLLALNKALKRILCHYTQK